MSFGGGWGREVQREEVSFFVSVSVEERGMSFLFAACV